MVCVVMLIVVVTGSGQRLEVVVDVAITGFELELDGVTDVELELELDTRTGMVLELDTMTGNSNGTRTGENVCR